MAARKNAASSTSVGTETTEVSVHQAKTHLSRLLDDAIAGKTVIVTRRGRPIVRLTPVEPRGDRVFGSMKGRISFDDSFFDPLPDDELELWNQG